MLSLGPKAEAAKPSVAAHLRTGRGSIPATISLVQQLMEEEKPLSWDGYEAEARGEERQQEAADSPPSEEEQQSLEEAAGGHDKDQDGGGDEASEPDVGNGTVSTPRSKADTCTSEDLQRGARDEADNKAAASPGFEAPGLWADSPAVATTSAPQLEASHAAAAAVPSSTVEPTADGDKALMATPASPATAAMQATPATPPTPASRASPATPEQTADTARDKQLEKAPQGGSEKVAQASTPREGSYCGILKMINARRAFGFISPVFSELPPECRGEGAEGIWFFGAPDLPLNEGLVGCKVHFNISAGGSGKPQATDVALCDDESLGGEVNADRTVKGIPTKAEQVPLAAKAPAQRLVGTIKAPDCPGASNRIVCPKGTEALFDLAKAPEGAIEGAVVSFELQGSRAVRLRVLSRQSQAKPLELEPKGKERYRKCFPCKAVVRGKACALGDLCPDAHSLEEVAPLPDTKVVRRAAQKIRERMSRLPPPMAFGVVPGMVWAPMLGLPRAPPAKRRKKTKRRRSSSPE